MGTSKRARVSGSTLVKAALYHYLDTQKWGKKAAKALLKKNKELSEVTPDFRLDALFDAISEELDNESARVKPRLETPADDPLSKIPAEVTPVKAGPLRRLDVDYWRTKAAIRDNSYEAKQGDSFAALAARDLGKVRGKDFRAAKNKKKRGGHKGIGHIDTGTHSVFFPDSDE